MQCDTRRGAATTISVGRPAPARREALSEGRLTALLALLLVPVLVVGLKGPGPGSREATELPAALVGTWVTDAPQYEGRTLGFAPGLVEVGRGGGDVVPYRVREVESISGPRGEGYRILHADVDGLIHTLEVHMRDDGTIRLLHPAEVVWRRR